MIDFPTFQTDLNVKPILRPVLKPIYTAALSSIASYVTVSQGLTFSAYNDGAIVLSEQGRNRPMNLLLKMRNKVHIQNASYALSIVDYFEPLENPDFSDKHAQILHQVFKNERAFWADFAKQNRLCSHETPWFQARENSIQANDTLIDFAAAALTLLNDGAPTERNAIFTGGMMLPDGSFQPPQIKILREKKSLPVSQTKNYSAALLPESDLHPEQAAFLHRANTALANPAHTTARSCISTNTLVAAGKHRVAPRIVCYSLLHAAQQMRQTSTGHAYLAFLQSAHDTIERFAPLTQDVSG